MKQCEAAGVIRVIELKQRAQSSLPAVGLASELKSDTIPYGRRFPVACCGESSKNGMSKTTEMPNISNRYVVFDVETTGFGPQRGARVIEIGAVLVADGNIISEFQSLINCGKVVSRQAQKVHGITDRMLFGQPAPEDIFPIFTDTFHDALLWRITPHLI